MAKQALFGTDGVRGEAGAFLTAELATALGRAAVERHAASSPQVLIIRDTRESGPMLESALAAGIASAGGDAWIGGVLPTPAAAILVRKLGLDLAVVVSASHNPYADNGIKFFGSDGTKLDDGAEQEIEDAVSRGGLKSASPTGRIRDVHGSTDDYLRSLEAHFPLDLSGRKVMLDCANGAAHRAAPAIFQRLGAEVVDTHCDPDGRNINEDCGSTHLGGLQTRMAAGEAEVGFAFDGDGDRVLAVDSLGEVHDGDRLLALNARYLKDRGELGGGVVVTVMTNFGFRLDMADNGIEVATTAVGDRHVLAELLDRGWRIGGEQSGHAIDTEFVPTGDGVATALAVMRSLGGARLEDIPSFERMPQRLINVKVDDRDAVTDSEAVREAIESEEAALRGRGRVLIRPSGTEPLVRVMVEAPDRAQADQICERLASLIARELGPRQS